MGSAIPRLARSRHVGSVGVFILCVNLWRYFHLMGSTILTLWGQGQSKSLFLHPRHSHVMRKPHKDRHQSDVEKKQEKKKVWVNGIEP